MPQRHPHWWNDPVGRSSSPARPDQRSRHCWTKLHAQALRLHLFFWVEELVWFEQHRQGVRTVEQILFKYSRGRQSILHAYKGVLEERGGCAATRQQPGSPVTAASFCCSALRRSTYWTTGHYQGEQDQHPPPASLYSLSARMFTSAPGCFSSQPQNSDLNLLRLQITVAEVECSPRTQRCYTLLRLQSDVPSGSS